MTTSLIRRFWDARSRCKNGQYAKRGIRFHLSEQEWINLCARDGVEKMLRPSIDRIDTNGHYKYDNCRFIELDQNIRRPRMKSRRTRNRYKGVYWSPDHKKFRVIVTKDGKGIHCGYFSDEKEAARIYNNRVSEIHNVDPTFNKV